MWVDERGLVLLGLGALLALVTSARVRRWWRAHRSRRRARKALAGERRALPLLRRHGFEIAGTQVPGSLVLEVDGHPHTLPLRADLLVTRGGKRYVAEVKTGQQAPQPQHRPTRRQLLEYHAAYGADGVLLVDMERGAVHEVRFPALDRTPRGAYRCAWVALVAGLVLGAGAATVLQP